MLSFVMIAYNEAERIEQSLRSIQELQGLDDYEIIVVDDGSSDNTGEIVSKIGASDHHVSLLRLEQNRGRGAARAEGVNVARGQYIAMIDADITLPKSWWEACREAIKDHDVVSGTAVPDGDVVYLSDSLKLEPKVVRHATATTGSNAVFRRDVFDEVKYDENRRNGEDVALGHAMQEHGIKTFVIPGLIVHHREDKTLVQATSWLFESGIGASRQLETFRQLRKPDIAAAVVFAMMMNVIKSHPAGRKKSLAALLFVLGGIATAHVHSKFVFDRRRPLRYAAGIGVDMLLLLSYVSGRIVGHGYKCRQSQS